MSRNPALQRVRARLGRANDLSDFELFVTPDDIRNELDQLKGSYDVVNLTAKGNPEWDAHYREFLAYYERQRPDIGWLSSTQATMNHVRDRRRQLEQWKVALAQKGVKVADPARKEPPSTAQDLSGLLWAGAALGGLLLAAKAMKS